MGNCCYPKSENDTKDVSIKDEIEFASDMYIPKLEECIEFNYDQILQEPMYCVRVYDGDTITIASRNRQLNKWIKYQVRIYGIDCPELRTKDANEKYVSEIARDHMISLVLGKRVYLTGIQKEKYGRVLANVYVDNINVADELIQKKLAVSYDGGTKKVPVDWKEYYEKKI
jgi:endonuclease YncB( thermonuclease family)